MSRHDEDIATDTSGDDFELFPVADDGESDYYPWDAPWWGRS